MLGLVDSGSTHNCISEAAAIKAGLTVVRRPGFQVAVANGEKITSSGICEFVQLQVENEIFSIDLYVNALGSFDAVLGVKWLRTLGPILWDFTSLTMQFKSNGHLVNWQGEVVQKKMTV